MEAIELNKSCSKELVNKLTAKEANIGIIGLGYVGLPLSIRFSNIGYKVTGFEIDTQKISYITNGKSYIKHIKDEEIIQMNNNKFFATNQFSKINEMDAIILCVPTPLNKYREPDLSYIINTMHNIAPYLREGQILSLESTTYPGTTEEVLKPIIEDQNLTVGQDFYLIYSPEREDPGNTKFTTQTIPKVIGGYSAVCLEIGMALYEQTINKLIPVSSTKAAEMTKLLENIHRSVNISLMNEMKMVADKMQIDIFEVINAAATKPFGFTPYYPGPGIGGHCIPIDPFYLTWKAREYGLHTRFIELAGEINNYMPQWVVEKLTTSLNKRQKAINGSNILIMGIAYKKNVDDMRESPSMHIMMLLRDLGANLAYSDPFWPEFPSMRECSFDLKNTDINAENLKKFDAVIISTAHDMFDYDIVAKYAKLIIDTRGIYHLKKLDNVVSA